ncbi:NAD(P)-binding protein [Decorospora gaudefroyi]|uniref:NAD(P)-binding protein n=1 Tax=Decorospora gaudefroyi TaxID=184978 RepID=A0A6A5KB93_9PLEO|nr:NAD(P)-binding protein [Decorospora gaudefroyi]
MAPRPRHALITGGSRGIGLAIAQLFAKNSYRCTLISRSEEDLKAAIATLQPLSPYTGRLHIFPSQASDTTDPPPEKTSSPYQHSYIAGNVAEASRFWCTTPSGAFGQHFSQTDWRNSSTDPSRIDVLVNCAGLSQAKLFTALAEGAMATLVSINLTAMMQGTKFLIRHGYLRNRQGKDEGEDDFAPVVINVSSLLGLRGGYGAVAYAASKAGVLGFTRALATEYASHGVRVNALVPGYVDSNMTKNLNTAEIKKRIPLSRFGTPDEIAHAALFLTQNQYAHNCILNLDGGLSAV